MNLPGLSEPDGVRLALYLRWWEKQPNRYPLVLGLQLLFELIKRFVAQPLPLGEFFLQLDRRF